MPVLLVIVFPAAMLIIDLLQDDTAWLIMLIATFIIDVLLAGLMTLINIFSVRHTAKKQYESSKAMQSNSDIVMDTSGIRESSEYGSTVVQWSVVIKAAESDTAVYIFFSQLQAFLIPKRLISPQEENVLRELIQSNLPSEKNKLRRAV